MSPVVMKASALERMMKAHSWKRSYLYRWSQSTMTHTESTPQSGNMKSMLMAKSVGRRSIDQKERSLGSIA